MDKKEVLKHTQYIIIKQSDLDILLERPDVFKPLLKSLNKNISININNLYKQTEYKSIRGLFKYLKKLKDNNIVNKYVRLNIKTINYTIGKLLYNILR